MLHKYMAPEGGDGGGGGGGGNGGDGGGGGSGGDQPFYSSFDNKEVAEWVKSFGDSYKTPESIAVKAYNLEKILGADKAGRALIPPKPDAKPEEWAEFYRKVGGASKPEEYGLPEALAKDEVATEFQKFAHSIGMPKSHFEKTIEWFVNRMNGSEEARAAALEGEAERDIIAVKTEWGAKSDEMIELGRRAARAFIPHENKEQLEEVLAKMEGAVGTGFMLRLWAAIGEGMGEHTFHGGSGMGGGGGMTPEAARLRIKELTRDQGFQSKIATGDAEAVAEWNKLNKIAASTPA